MILIFNKKTKQTFLFILLYIFLERARRVQLREERAKLIAEGKEIPPHLMNIDVSHHGQNYSGYAFIFI